jgi:hypothetical protein
MIKPHLSFIIIVSLVRACSVNKFFLLSGTCQQQQKKIASLFIIFGG